MAQPRVVIIGAGPAGVRAAEAVVAAGLRPIVIDESTRDGGQIYRRQPSGFTRSYQTLYGTEAGRARALHDTFDRLKPHIDYHPDTLVWNLAEGRVWISCNGAVDALEYDAVLLCTGATDRVMPVKGWHYAGTFSLGAAQVALKSQGCAVGRRVVFLGSGPLLYLVAAQYVKAGAEVAAVIDTAPLGVRIKALPKLLSAPDVLWNGMLLTLALKRAGVPVHHAAEPLEILGDPESGVSGVRFRAGGREQVLRCDAVAMGHHLRPETQLADLARCDFAFDALTRQWLPVRDGDGRSSVSGLYLAGDGAAILGARAAEASGRLAALTALDDLGLAAPDRSALRQELARYDRFARGLAQAFPWPSEQTATLPDDAILCRCEGVTVGEMRRVDAREANRAKAFNRVGMGRCQGRYCGLAGAEVLAAALGIPLEQVGRLRGQAPVKPLAFPSGESAP
jgi:NADPH-dependent 2,4-dienoyl-CoA reductase/sulfur reductase-like enzyme